jgi:hypothetical protein
MRTGGKQSYKSGGGSAEPALRAGSQQGVNHDVGTAGFRCQLTEVGVGQVPDPAAGPLKGRKRFGMGTARGEDRRRPHAPSSKARGREKAVAAVVPLAAQHYNAGTVEPVAPGAQLPNDRIGKAVGCPLHENSAHT